MSNTLKGYAQQKRYRSNPRNHQKYLQYLAVWRSNHQSQIKEYRRQYYQKNKERLNKISVELHRLRRQRLKILKEINEIAASRGTTGPKHNFMQSRPMEVSL